MILIIMETDNSFEIGAIVITSINPDFLIYFYSFLKFSVTNTCFVNDRVGHMISTLIEIKTFKKSVQ